MFRQIGKKCELNIGKLKTVSSRRLDSGEIIAVKQIYYSIDINDSQRSHSVAQGRLFALRRLIMDSSLNLK